MHIWAVDAHMGVLQALRALSPREEALFAVYQQGRLVRILDSHALERALLGASPQGTPPTLGDLFARAQPGPWLNASPSLSISSQRRARL